MKIKDVVLGPGECTYIALEIGPTIEGVITALTLTRSAAAAGADAIKVQMLDPDRLVGRDTDVSYELEGGDPAKESMRAILRRRVLTPEEWRAVKAEADRQGLGFIATVDFPHTLALAIDLGADAIKVCSGDVNHLDWVAEVGRACKPVLLDTGHATLGEVEAAVDVALEAGADGVCVHHVPGGYPARLPSVNLRVITTLIQMFPECAIGFSDHTPGRDMDLAAVALGAAMIEKTFTMNRATRGPEHMMSVEPQEAGAFIQAIRELEVALGSPRRHFTGEERRRKHGARRSAFLAKDLRAGMTVARSAIEWRRPGDGIEPADAPHFLGRALRHDLPAGHQLEAADFA